MLETLVILFLVVMAIFWGLAPHSMHCALVPGANCAPHWVHISIGIVCFLLAIYVAQMGYIQFMLGVK